MASGDGFLSRWSQRKAGARSGVPAVEAPAMPTAPAPNEPAAPSAMVTLPLATSPPPAAEPVALPTLDDVAKLTHASDYSPFVARGVDAAVRNAAMKKLFSDPHFNVMDGLDTYIDDYGKPDPIPLSMLRRMNQSTALGLFADEAATVPDDTIAVAAADALPDGADPLPMAESASASLLLPEAPSPADDDTDLQLQRDDADRRAGIDPGTRR